MLEVDLMQSFPPGWFECDEDDAIDLADDAWNDDEKDEDFTSAATSENRSEQFSVDSLSVTSLPCVSFDDRRLLPSAPGVYFVYFVQHDRVLPFYIGRATLLLDRWKNHEKIPALEKIQSVIGPLTIFYLETSDHKKLELSAIQKFEPLMNYQFKKRIAIPAGNQKKDIAALEFQQRINDVSKRIDDLRSESIKRSQNSTAMFLECEKDIKYMDDLVQIVVAENTRLRDLYIQMSLENQSLRRG